MANRERREGASLPFELAAATETGVRSLRGRGQNGGRLPLRGWVLGLIIALAFAGPKGAASARPADRLGAGRPDARVLRPATNHKAVAGMIEMRQAPAQPTPVPEILTGRLDLPRPSDPCRHDAILRQCHSGEIRRVRSDADLSPFLGYDVRIEALPFECESGGGSYLQVLTVSRLTGGCGPTPTPPPTPTPAPAENMAQGAPYVARDAVPGNPASAANDGDPGTAWRSDSEVTWIYFDLGHGIDRDRTFNQMVLRWGVPYATSYAVYVWEQNAWSGIYQTLTASDGGEDVISLPRTYARFALLYLVRSSHGRGYELAEWEIYGRETVNHGLGGAVEVSSAVTGHPGHHANDGDRATYWQSLAPDLDPNAWLRIALPGVYVAELRLYWVEDHYPQLFTVVLYDRDQMRQSTWQPRTAVNRIAPPSPIRADAVLVYSRVGSKSGPIALQEIELYESGLAAGMTTARLSWSASGATAAVPDPEDWLAEPWKLGLEAIRRPLELWRTREPLSATGQKP